MKDEHYTIANLEPDQIEEIRQAEQHLSSKLGYPISLIAYQADSEDRVE